MACKMEERRLEEEAYEMRERGKRNEGEEQVEEVGSVGRWRLQGECLHVWSSLLPAFAR